MNKGIQRAVDRSLIYSNLKNEDRIILGVSLYNHIIKKSKIDSSITSNLNQSLTEVLPLHQRNVSEFRDIFATYNAMVHYIKKKELKHFSQVNDNDYSILIDLYRDKTRNVKFSDTRYNHRMYKVHRLTMSEDEYLSKIHRNIVVPIAKFYEENRGIPLENMTIVDSTMSDTKPGKDILFYINGIDSGLIVSDIRTNRIILNPRYFERVYLEDNNVRIIMR